MLLAYQTSKLEDLFQMPMGKEAADLIDDKFEPSYEAGELNLITIAGSEENLDANLQGA